MDHLGIGKAAVFGYSMGAGAAIRLTMDYPARVERLVAASGSINYDSLPPYFYDMIKGMTPEMFEGTPFIEEYNKYAPDPNGFPNLMAKLKALDLDRFAWNEEQFAAIDVPTLLIFGDADVVSMEHAVKMFKLLGGHQDGDSNGLPLVQLAVLPGTPHTGVVFNPQNIEYLKMMVPVFLGQELPQPPMMPGT
jgi:pimeloyl-ACP methyl ester carboxylesterase